MPRIHSFPPIESRNARVMILGSMPGMASLAANQYYAHPRNAFWRIVAETVGFDPALPYNGRVRAVKAAGIAVWDVLQSCTREGSLDSGIDRNSLKVNDFGSFFRTHPAIERVYFNGAKAEECFNGHVLGKIETGAICYARLPSTSPAHASLSFAQKRKAWRVIVEASKTTPGVKR